jgi:chromosome segregation ATPase
MSTTDRSSVLKKKLLSRIATVQKQADAAKKAAKLAKAGFKAAKQKFKETKRTAKKHRKELKALKAELALFAVKKNPARKPAAKPAAKRLRPSATEIPVPAAEPENAPALIEQVTGNPASAQ